MENTLTSAQQINRAFASNNVNNNNNNISRNNNMNNNSNNNNNNGQWKSYFTPERLKLFHTIVLIMFLVLIMSYIFNTKSNVIRVIIILSLSAFMLCESFVVYSYKWSS